MADALVELLTEIRACRICTAQLPLGPRPVLQAAASSRLLIVGQAPGRKVHPSPRNRLWLARNPWFEAELLPALRVQVAAALDQD
jgi:uracil-DNA glycosylase